MDSGEALTRFFQRNSEQANQLTLYPHMEKQFWHWLSTWAIFLQKPSDLGHPDTGYDMPPIKVHWHKIEVDHSQAWKKTDRSGQSALFLDDAAGLTEAAATKRDSIHRRLDHAREIIAHEPLGKYWLIWHDLEAERHAIEKAIPLAKSVYGSQDLDEREDLIVGFSQGDYRILATKPSLAGSGCNFQKHCADAVFLGVGYKFNDFIQAIHRIYRFGQSRQVNIHILYLDSESSIKDALETKWRQHEELVARMTELLRTYRLQAENPMELLRSLVTGDDRAESRGDLFRAIHNDTALELPTWPENSVHHICTSIPFGNQYEYSPTFNDLGHNTGDDGFFEQMDFIVPELLRVLKPGRVAAIHVKDRIQFGNVTGMGFPTVSAFSDKTRECFQKHGFAFIARITIDTDVVRENSQTYRLGWTENSKDSTKMGAGMPEYVLVFRKPPSDLSDGYADEPVTKLQGLEGVCQDCRTIIPKPRKNETLPALCDCGGHVIPTADDAILGSQCYTRADWQLDAAGLWRSDGNRLQDPEILKHMPLDHIKRIWTEHSKASRYSHEQHAQLANALEDLGALPSSFMLFPPISRNPDVWTDIARMRTLNTEQSKRAEEKHVCPLQLDIIKRLISRYTNDGEIVLDPFLGIGSTAYQAIKMGRQGWGIELNREYWRCATGYCEAAEAEISVPTLFDMALASERQIA